MRFQIRLIPHGEPQVLDSPSAQDLVCEVAGLLHELHVPRGEFVRSRFPDGGGPRGVYGYEVSDGQREWLFAVILDSEGFTIRWLDPVTIS